MAEISLNEMQKSVIEKGISVIEMQLSVFEIQISVFPIIIEIIYISINRDISNEAKIQIHVPALKIRTDVSN